MNREQLKNILTAALSNITQANGYSSNIGLDVQYGTRIVEDPENECVAIYIGQRMHGEDLMQNTFTNVLYTFEVVLDIVVYNDIDALNKADAAIEDLLKLFTEKPDLDTTGLIVKVEEDEAAISQFSSAKAHAAMRLTIVI